MENNKELLKAVTKIRQEARRLVQVKVREINFRVSDEEKERIAAYHFPYPQPVVTHIWDNLDEPVEHFMGYIYKPLLKTFSKRVKSIYYDFIADHKRGHVSDMRKIAILMMSNYRVSFTEKGYQVEYPLEVREIM